MVVVAVKKSSYAKKRKAGRHWLIERFIAVLLLPFSLWFIWSALPALLRSSEEVTCWFHNSWHATGALFWTGLLFWHGCLGMQVVLEDYLPLQKGRTFALVCCRLFSLLGAFCACFEIILLWRGRG